MPNHHLPAGSVVLLKDSTKKVMIMGFAQTKPETREKIYDYCGCLYPEGYQNAERIFLFDHSSIDRVYHVGYMDEEQFRFEEKLEEALLEFKDKR